MGLIDGEALRKAMYHEAFETNTDMQRWDSGCWIRYKMFENTLSSAPTVDAVHVVRCKDCKHYWKNSKYEDDMDAVAMCLASPEDDAFCSMGEREDDGT